MQTRHGRHLYFTGARSLPYFAKLGPKIHLLGPGHYIELPPSAGKVWVRHVEGRLPRLPRHLRALVAEREAASVGEVVADTQSDLAAWRDLLGELYGGGPTYRARCPLHPDDHASFSVFPGQRDGRLLGRCHAGCGTWTLRRLRHRIGDRRTGQYTAAHAAITALGDSIEDTTRDALRWLVGQAERHRLNLLDPDGIGGSYRQLAASTGLERVGDDGRLSNRGRSIGRLIGRLRDIGVHVLPGEQYHPGGSGGRTTRFRLPEAWVTAPGDAKR